MKALTAMSNTLLATRTYEEEVGGVVVVVVAYLSGGSACGAARSLEAVQAARNSGLAEQTAAVAEIRHILK